MESQSLNQSKMKREHHHLRTNPGDPPSMVAAGGSYSCGGGGGYSIPITRKSKLLEEEDADGGMDELIAGVGYKVRSSNMAEVAQKVEQLDEAMGNIQDGIPQLSFETIHYNLSDISTWLKSILSGLNPPAPTTATAVPPPNDGGRGGEGGD